MGCTLQEINTVVGVKGSFACAMDGRIILQAMPETFDLARLDGIARIATQTFNALELVKQHVSDVDLIFTQQRLVFKNLRGGVVIILCDRNINIPLLNMTANNAAKKISAELCTKSAALPEPVELQPTTPPLGQTLTQPVEAASPEPSPVEDDEGSQDPLYIKLEKESRRLLAAAKSADIRICIMDPIALWQRCDATRARVSQPQNRCLDVLVRTDQADAFSRVLGQLGFQPNQRFNATYGTRYLCFDDSGRMISINVFLDAFDMYQRVDLTDVLAQNETVMTVNGLALIRLQIVESSDSELNELCALFLEHDLSNGTERDKIDSTQIARLCAEDWGWYRTVTANLKSMQDFCAANSSRLNTAKLRVTLSQERLKDFTTKEFGPSEEELLMNRIRRLREEIEATPKSLRWHTRARIGDSAQWHEIPRIGASARLSVEL